MNKNVGYLIAWDASKTAEQTSLEGEALVSVYPLSRVVVIDYRTIYFERDAGRISRDYEFLSPPDQILVRVGPDVFLSRDREDAVG